jgi:hypothetical protein
MLHDEGWRSQDIQVDVAPKHEGRRLATDVVMIVKIACQIAPHLGRGDALAGQNVGKNTGRIRCNPITPSTSHPTITIGGAV